MSDEPIVKVVKGYIVYVPYTDVSNVEVEADSEAEAIAKAMEECPVDDGVNPLEVCTAVRGERRYRASGWSSWYDDNWWDDKGRPRSEITTDQQDQTGVASS
jgi:hypothetical protein